MKGEEQMKEEKQRKGEVERMKNIIKMQKTGNKRNNINSTCGNNIVLL